MAKYLIKDVLLALRQEYINNQNKLKELKKYITLLDKSVVGTSFTEYSRDYTKKLVEEQCKYIELELIKDESAFQKLKDLIKIRSKRVQGVKPKKVIQLSHELDGEKRFVIVPNEETYKINDLNRFYNATDKIIGSQFMQNIYTPVIEIPNSKMEVSFNESGMTIKANETPNHSLSSIDYVAKNDQIQLTPHHEFLYPDQVDELFHTEVGIDNLPDYHKEIITNSSESKKDFRIKGIIDSTNTQRFEIQDDDNKVTLRRIK